MEEFITFLGDCGIPETNGGENDYQTNGSTPEISCNFNLDEVFDLPDPLMNSDPLDEAFDHPDPLVNSDPIWQKSPLSSFEYSSFLGDGGIPKTNGGENDYQTGYSSFVGDDGIP